MAKQRKNFYIFPSVSTDTQNDEARKLWLNKIENKGWLQEGERAYVHKETGGGYVNVPEKKVIFTHKSIPHTISIILHTINIAEWSFTSLE